MNISGENPNYLWEDLNLLYICDTFIADYFSGRDMTHIRKTGIDMEEFYEHSLNYLFIIIHYYDYGLPPTRAATITVSPMFRTIFNYMDRRIYINEHSDYKEINSSSPKYVIYSGHDSTSGAINVFLNQTLNISYDRPVYATSQYFELWEKDKKYYVKYLVNQVKKGEYEYEIFKDQILGTIFSEDEIEEICFGETTIKKESFVRTLFFIVVSILIVALLLLISLIILGKMKKNL